MAAQQLRFSDECLPLDPPTTAQMERGRDLAAELKDAQDRHSRIMLDQSLYSDPQRSSYPLPMDIQSQPVRHANDLYSPRWVRGNGKTREGWCSFCTYPGRWHLLKNSSFWYDKTFVHGISSITGRRFDGPACILQKGQVVRAAMACIRLPCDIGQCATCDKWIPLGLGKVDGNGMSRYPGSRWFRHASKCHRRPGTAASDDGESVCGSMTSPESADCSSPHPRHHPDARDDSADRDRPGLQTREALWSASAASAADECRTRQDPPPPRTSQHDW